jgi:hypothetical protein
MSAKTKVQTTVKFKLKSKKRRPGIHAKTKQSTNKSNKNYVKVSVGQG